MNRSPLVRSLSRRTIARLCALGACASLCACAASLERDDAAAAAGAASNGVQNGAQHEARHAPEAPTSRTTEDGLVIEDVRVGTGAVCPPGATVTVFYSGALADGTVFDSTDARGRPMTFELARLIRGWQEGVPGMRIGGVRRLTIPYPLAYGEQGRPPRIPARAELTFEIELIDFEPPTR
ncbi:MAG: FKBP-type peptidyl-prolyl cis-trans isomerase [Phycisphaerales bacterium]|nr:MAG: FKBP-type peptidyl-prolyl cis-trans isomerase [Phycisphaerales bacterium]